MPELHAAPCAVDPCMTRTGTRMRRAPACGECARTCEAAMHLPAAAPRLRGGGRRRAREGSTAVRRGERGQAARTGDSDISVRASGGSRSWGLQKLGIAAEIGDYFFKQPDSTATPQGRRLSASDTAQGRVRTGNHSIARSPP